MKTYTLNAFDADGNCVYKYSGRYATSPEQATAWFKRVLKRKKVKFSRVEATCETG